MVFMRMQKSADLWQEKVDEGIQLFEKTKALTEAQNPEPLKVLLQGATYYFQVMDGFLRMADIWSGGSGASKGPSDPLRPSITMDPSDLVPTIYLVVDDQASEANSPLLDTDFAGANLKFTLYNVNGTKDPYINKGTATVVNGKLKISAPQLDTLGDIPDDRNEEHWAGVLYTMLQDGTGNTLARIQLVRVKTKP
jgi:hypothetical protein